MMMVAAIIIKVAEKIKMIASKTNARFFRAPFLELLAVVPEMHGLRLARVRQRTLAAAREIGLKNATSEAVHGC